MMLQVLIKEKLSNRDINLIAKQLGYSSSDRLISRINAIIESPYLALDKSSFDFKYSTPELIRKLCELCNISLVLCNTIISQIESKLTLRRCRFNSHIYIDTDFKRKSEAVFVLAALESSRYIAIDEVIQDLPLNEQLDHIKQLVTSHYQKQSSLPVWGDIQRYVYFFDENIVIVLSSEGEVVGSSDEYSMSRATVWLKS